MKGKTLFDILTENIPGDTIVDKQFISDTDAFDAGTMSGDEYLEKWGNFIDANSRNAGGIRKLIASKNQTLEQKIGEMFGDNLDPSEKIIAGNRELLNVSNEDFQSAFDKWQSGAKRAREYREQQNAKTQRLKDIEDFSDLGKAWNDETWKEVNVSNQPMSLKRRLARALLMKAMPQGIKNEYVETGKVSPETAAVHTVAGALEATNIPIVSDVSGPALRAGDAIYKGMPVKDALKTAGVETATNVLFSHAGTKFFGDKAKQATGQLGGDLAKETGKWQKFVDNLEKAENIEPFRKKLSDVDLKINDYKNTYLELPDKAKYKLAKEVESVYPNLGKAIKDEAAETGYYRAIKNDANSLPGEILNAKVRSNKAKATLRDKMKNTSKSIDVVNSGKPIYDEAGNLTKEGALLQKHHNGEQMMDMMNLPKYARPVSKVIKTSRPVGRVLTGGADKVEPKKMSEDRNTVEKVLDWYDEQYGKDWEKGFKPYAGFEPSDEIKATPQYQAWKRGKWRKK